MESHPVNCYFDPIGDRFFAGFNWTRPFDHPLVYPGPDPTSWDGQCITPGAIIKDNNIYYYEGMLAPDGSNFKSTNFKGIRDVILTKKKSTDPKDFVVVIKPNKESTYKNTVDMLDEMTINDVKRYALVDIAEAEQMMIAATEGANPQ